MARVLRSILGMLSLGTLCVLPLLQAAESPPRPNVVIILADDLGYSDLGCYGGEIDTPVLDGLARSGLRFTQFYNTARCWPTRAALLTGYYAQQVHRDGGIPGYPGGTKQSRPDWARLLPEMLRTAGYRSYHSGKWHVDGDVLTGGFDQSYSLNNHNGYFGPKSQFVDDRPIPAGDSNIYVTDEIARRAIDQLRDHQTSHAQQPFFLYIAYTAPHFPLHAPQFMIDRYRERYRAGWDALRQARAERQKVSGLLHTPLSELEPDVGPPYPFPEAIAQLGPGEVNRPVPWDSLTPEQQEFQATKMAIHAAMVDCMDQSIGRILEQIRVMQAEPNTVVFFLSDNGASAEMMIRGDGHDPSLPGGSAGTYLCLGPGFSSLANTPFRRHKTWVHEGGISTPLIVHGPPHLVPPGELRQTPGHVIDLLPTVLELARAEPLLEWNGKPVPEKPGRSLVPALARDVTIERPDLWWLHEGNRAIRRGDWKLVSTKDGDWELYDMSQDRAESHNLAQQHPERVAELKARWQNELQAMADLFKTEH